ncbi:MAG: hypothetical protein CME68_07545 [Halobacteriovoraceae bacterium]|nr:hypothetical protein [Halobacteriovoraceae bacterium]
MKFKPLNNYASNLFHSVFPYLIYPGTLLSGFLFFNFLKENEVHPYIAAMSSLMFSSILITFFEFTYPYRKEWQNIKSDVKTDFLHMGVTQLILPRILEFFFVPIFYTLITSIISEYRWESFTHFWPHHSPIWFQVILMMVCNEFLRYWVHRMAHTKRFLWKLHSVHHSSEVLYWFNSGRFHPLEKVIQFIPDTLIFLLIGMNEAVLTTYLVFYGINGFFQHSNINVKFGFLNYIISSSELHRWHHSEIPRESNGNYGNNLIIWDVIFGTWFLPKDRSVGEIGLRNRNFPKEYLTQLKAPFISKIDLKEVPVPTSYEILEGIGHKILNFAMKSKVLIVGSYHYKNLVNACHNPRETQEKVLLNILDFQKETFFGREHNFNKINSIKEFQDNVPPQDYESLRPFIDKQDETGEPHINAEDPIIYAVTSGSTGSPKFIPVLKRTIESFKRSQLIQAYSQIMERDDVISGKIMAIMGASIEGHRKSNIPYGSASGFVKDHAPKIAKKKYVIPGEVAYIEDNLLKYQAIIRLILCHDDITFLGSANPSTFIRILDLVNEYWSEYSVDLKEGTFFRDDDLDDNVKKALQPLYSYNPDKAERLDKIFKDDGGIKLLHIFPNLQILATWTGGSCGTALGHLKGQFPEKMLIRDAGYLSSEFRGTIPLTSNKTTGIPTILDNFYEFIERDLYDSGDRNFILIDQLEDRKEYYIFVTTEYGLYRYFMNDVIRVEGFKNKTPRIKFIQKGRGVTNITGEKLYEGQLIDAMSVTENEMHLNSKFFLMVANEKDSCYELFIEPSNNSREEFKKHLKVFSENLDDHLSNINVEFYAKRKSGRLKATHVSLLKKNTYEEMKNFYIEVKKQREAQFKPNLLQYQKDLEFQINNYAEDSREIDIKKKA